MAVGLTGVPGVPAVAVEVREFSSVGENVQTQHPATGELTALARQSERETATLMEVGLTGVPGVAAVLVEVREFSSVGENIQSQTTARWSKRETATLVIPVRFNFYSSETIFLPFSS